MYCLNHLFYNHFLATGDVETGGEIFECVGGFDSGADTDTGHGEYVDDSVCVEDGAFDTGVDVGGVNLEAVPGTGTLGIACLVGILSDFSGYRAVFEHSLKLNPEGA